MRLKTQAQLAMRESDPDSLRFALEQISGSADRATHLVKQLLSLARAETLKAYLADVGYAGAITTEGRGEDQPFKPDDATTYDTEMLNQLNRRVEVDVE